MIKNSNIYEELTFTHKSPHLPTPIQTTPLLHWPLPTPQIALEKPKQMIKNSNIYRRLTFTHKSPHLPMPIQTPPLLLHWPLPPSQTPCIILHYLSEYVTINFQDAWVNLVCLKACMMYYNSQTLHYFSFNISFVLFFKLQIFGISSHRTECNNSLLEPPEMSPFFIEYFTSSHITLKHNKISLSLLYYSL